MTEEPGPEPQPTPKTRINLSLALPFAGGVGLFALLFAPLPRVFQTPLGQSLLNATHLPVFAAFVLIGRILLSSTLKQSPQRANFTSFGLVTFGAVAVELVQPKFGRSGSLEDAVIGVVGATLMLITPWFFGADRSTGRRAIWFFLAVVASIAVTFPALRELKAIQYRDKQFPILGDFERDDVLSYWIPAGYLEPISELVSRSDEHSQTGDHSLHVKCVRGKWPGVFMTIGGQDWSDYKALEMDIYNPGKQFEVGIRLDDDHPDSEFWGFRYDGLFYPTNGWNHISIPMKTIATGGRRRGMNITDIRRMILFVDWKQKPCEWFLDNVRLIE